MHRVRRHAVKSREAFSGAIAVTRELVHAWDPGQLLDGGAPLD